MERINREFLLTVQLPMDAGVIELRRCDDHFFCKARSLGISVSYSDLWLWLMITHSPGLPKTYTVLSTLTGPSGDLYDYQTGAFAFPFKMTIRRGKQQFRYLLKLTNHRFDVHPHLYRLSQPGEPQKRNVHNDPFEDELSNDEFFYLLNFINGYIVGFCETAPKWTEPFVKDIWSNFILFGYDPMSGEFFEEDYETEEEYQAALERWRATIPVKTMEEQLAELEW